MDEFERAYQLAKNINKNKDYSGFDRGVDYEDARQRLSSYYHLLVERLNNPKKSSVVTLRLIIYTLIALTQLKNGCRISEACVAFYTYKQENSFIPSIKVRISKSDAAKKNKQGETFIPKTRFRDIVFQKFVDVSPIESQLLSSLQTIPFSKLKKRVLAHLIRNFDFNTHSLRYSRVTYLLNTKGIDVVTVSKFIGHNNINTIIKYVQDKNVKKLYEL